MSQRPTFSARDKLSPLLDCIKPLNGGRIFWTKAQQLACDWEESIGRLNRHIPQDLLLLNQPYPNTVWEQIIWACWESNSICWFIGHKESWFIKLYIGPSQAIPWSNWVWFVAHLQCKDAQKASIELYTLHKILKTQHHSFGNIFCVCAPYVLILSHQDARQLL